MPIARIPFSQNIESRAASISKDSRTVNCYFESKGEQGGDVVKRPGLLDLAISPALGTSTPQGMYEFNSALYIVTSNTLYKVVGTTVTTVGTISGTVQNIYWAETKNHEYLFFHNGTNGYVITGAGAFSTVLSTSVYEVTLLTGGSGYVNPTVTFSAPGAGTTATGTVQSSSGVITGITLTNVGSGYTSAPTATVIGAPGVGCTTTVTLSGFPATALAAGAVYLDGYTVVATVVGQIYNSNLNDPRFWNPVNYTSAEADPDEIVGIVKHFNYICVFGQWGTEFFYDAATASGSPFLRQESYKAEIGAANGGSIVQYQQAVVFVGVSKIRGKTVYMLDGVTPKPISTRYIEKYLNGDNTNSFQAFAFRIAGHTFYVITITASNLTFVYDQDEQKWYQWSSYSSGAENYFRIWTATEFGEVSVGLDATTGQLHKLDVSTYSDNGTAIYFRVVTGNLDSGTMKRKFYRAGQIVGDKVSATMSINHSDDDYVTYSTARTVDLSKARCIIYQCGWARRRAWQFLVTDNVALRLSAFEVDVDGGDQESDPQMQGR